ncbi:hypothetical protein CBF17_018950 [Pantoea agglomerans]|uniref:hypothetical protein n=1 Tax=Enterobacter agglomerans TaxID=549 RepID=UPI000C06BE8C|nr:hypothetical protein [Pantoea agglomerans]PHP92253.1 hypothetical protein CBF17_018950 [Pantoea agglomerans]
MSVSEATTGGKSVAELVENLENQAARRSDANWHEGLKSSTKIALEKINGAFEAKWITADESLSLKQRVYSVQDKLIELALW